jgi:hypothetical protein
MDLERTLRNLEVAMQEQNFQSKEEAELFVQGWMKRQNHEQSESNKKDNREAAQDILYDAESEPNAKKRVQLAKQAIALYPDSPDAYRILATEASTLSDQLRYLKQGMEAGERDLGKKFFEENQGHFWGIVSSRPYIRVKHAYAETCWHQGNLNEAASELENIVQLNSMDNMGARYLLIGIYLELNRLEDAERLLRTYDEEASAAFAYSRIILEYKRNGITAKLAMLCIRLYN